MNPITFGITPFTREISIEQRFKLEFMEKAANSLCEVIEKRMIGSVIAPAGAGKTVVLRNIKDRLVASRYKVCYLKVTDLSQRDLCREISNLLDARVSNQFHDLVRSVQESLIKTYTTDGIRPVLIIDEAHDLRPKSIRILKLITNFKMDSQLVVGVILAGQPSLRNIINQPELADIAQRIYHHVELPLLSRDESYSYLKHRCDISGLVNFPFDEQACAALFEITKGNMRALDHLALKSIEGAQSCGLGRVDAASVVIARKSLWI